MARTLLRTSLETWKAKALIAKAEREQWDKARELADKEFEEKDPMVRALEEAVWEAERASGRMANALERVLEKTQKMVDEVWTECDRILKEAEYLTHKLEQRERNVREVETQAWAHREKIAASREIGVRVVEWIAGTVDGETRLGQAIQVWTKEGWRDVPIIRIPARGAVERVAWKDVRQDEGQRGTVGGDAA